MAGERRGFKPGAIREERVAAEMRDGGLEMKATGDRNDDDFIIVGRKNRGKPADAFAVAAPREADKELSANAQDIATFESARRRNVFELSKFRERFSERRRLATASLRSQRQNHRQFIENDGRIFDEHGVRRSGSAGREITRAPNLPSSFS